MEVLGASSIAVTGLPSVPTEALPARAEFLVWWGGMTIQGLVWIYCEVLMMNSRGDVKEGWVNWGIYLTLYGGAPTLGQVDSEFQRWHGRTDLASAYVLRHLNHWVLYFKSGTVRTAVGRTEVWSIPDQKEVGGLGEWEETILSWYLNWLYYTWVACFYNYWEQCRVMSAAREEWVSLRQDYRIFGQGRWRKAMKWGGRAGLGIQSSKNRSKG